jgi:hypothetical protein
VTLPRILLVKQHVPDRRLADVAGAVRAGLERAGLASRVKPGARIAIGSGSRGVANVATIVKAVVDYWLAHGCRPFVFPAMGSHGSATAEGQAAVLAGYGITQASVGCPVVSSLEVVSTGETPEGIRTFVDRHAFESDGIVLVGRVKWHTDFDGAIESGLVKMSAIGLGKLAGAQQYHIAARRYGMERIIRSAFRQVSATGKLLGGVAVLEDGRHNTAEVVVLPAAEIEAREPELLARVKTWRARLPVEALDLLVVDEIGKPISGTGMDTKVVNRSIQGHFNCYPDLPVIQRIFIRDLAEDSGGNAIGIGMADVIADRLIARMDPQATYINSLTACNPEGSRMPIHFPTDRECIERIAPTAGQPDPGRLKIGWIMNTLRLDVLGLSENLTEEICKNPDLTIASPPLEWPFDGEGNLAGLAAVARRYVEE